MKMQRKIMRGTLGLGLGLVGLAAVGCGGGSSGGAPQSYAEAKAAIESPTGTVDAETAVSVAEAYEQSLTSAPGGIREKAQAQSVDLSAMCTGGGSANGNLSGNQTSGTMAISYSNCCISAGTENCCYNGTANTYYNNGAADSCVSYDLSLTCGTELAADLSMAYCINADMTFSYAVIVDGETFAVQGTYAGGNGTLTITGENGTFECTYTNGTGSCTGAGEFSF